MVPCSRGRINGTKTIVMRDTGSTTCVVKKSLVKPEQMTGSYELCRLIDGVVKRYPTAMVELDTPYFIGKTKVLCMDNPARHHHWKYTKGKWSPSELCEYQGHSHS